MNEKQRVLLERAGALRQQTLEELQKRLTPEDLGLVQRLEILMLYSALLGGLEPGPNWDAKLGWEEMEETVVIFEFVGFAPYPTAPPSADGSEAPVVDGAGGAVG